VRNAGANPPSQCTSGTQVYLGTGTSVTDTDVANGLTYYYRACANDNAGNVSAGVLANFIIKYQLTTTVNTPGEGGIAPDCPDGCLYNSGTSVGLTAIPTSGYVLSSWGGDCSGAGLITSATMNGQMTCTATFSSCADQPALTAWSGAPYDAIGGIAGAYANAHDPNDTIQLLATTFVETLDLTRDISVTLSGGWDCGFSPNTSYSIIHGSLTVSNGKVIVERLIIY